MSGPGKGRYTTYVPAASDRNAMLSKLFNGKASDGKALGVIYGGDKGYQTDNHEAAAKAVAVATGDKGLIPSSGIQKGDSDMFPNNVDLKFGGAPDLKSVEWKTATSTFGGAPSNAGGPANPYVPDLTSPGPGGTSGVDKKEDPGITAAAVKPNYTPGSGTGATMGTVSPSSTSSVIGSSPIGADLTKGKSSI